MYRPLAQLLAVAATKLLCECPPLLSDASSAVWGQLLDQAVALLERGQGDGAAGAEDDDANEEAEGYTAAYAALAMAGKKEMDPCPEIADARAFLVSSLGAVARQVPAGSFAHKIQAALAPSNKEAFSQMAVRAGVCF